MDSILNSIKQVLSMEPNYEAFDEDIMMFVNSVFATLHQIGVGPKEGFVITDDTAVWSDFVDDKVQQNLVKPYVYLKARMLFDPPNTSFHITAMQEQINEFEFRISQERESNVARPPVTSHQGVYDGD